MTEEIERRHEYHAEAQILSCKLTLPLEQDIQPQGFATLPAVGGYIAQQSGEFHVESVLSYRAAHTQVAGNKETKPGRGWNTLTTSMIEGLNILDVITADRVVAQISTEHPLIGYIPRITFLGTRFENLCIAGHPVELDLNLGIFGEKPVDDQPYTRSQGFVERVTRQHARIREQHAGYESPLAGLLERYNRVPESFANAAGTEENVECSLVNQADGKFPGRCFGHVLHVPSFGTIHLAALHLRHFDPHPKTGIPQQTHVHLNMVEANMGCVAQGTVAVGTTRTNGGTVP